MLQEINMNLERMVLLTFFRKRKITFLSSAHRPSLPRPMMAQQAEVSEPLLQAQLTKQKPRANTTQAGWLPWPARHQLARARRR